MQRLTSISTQRMSLAAMAALRSMPALRHPTHAPAALGSEGTGVAKSNTGYPWGYCASDNQIGAGSGDINFGPLQPGIIGGGSGG